MSIIIVGVIWIAAIIVAIFRNKPFMVSPWYGMGLPKGVLVCRLCMDIRELIKGTEK